MKELLLFVGGLLGKVQMYVEVGGSELFFLVVVKFLECVGVLLLVVLGVSF